MKVYDFASKKFQPTPAGLEAEQLILCRAQEIHSLRNTFGWDESTVQECTNLDENVRYTGFDSYDFISLMHLEFTEGTLAQREINLYVSRRYLVLVLPAQESPRLARMEAALCLAAEGVGVQRLYSMIFDWVTTDISDALEALEDEMETLSERIIQKADQHQITEIGRLRRMAYTAKKLLRALSYIGGQIVMNENGLLEKHQVNYFHSIDTRLKKLYDFAESLHDLNNELLHMYDSKLAIKMNDMVNKLTVITLFFGPLTVITGVYGMNFVHMPELDWPLGYPMVVGIMALVSLGMYLVLKIKKWL
jgi:magnesium transporter